MLNVLGKCALMMTVMVKSSAQIEPFYASKGNKIWFILLFSNCFFAIGAVRYVGLGIRPTYSKTWICNNDLLDLGINNNNNNSLHLYSAFLLFSKHSKRSTLWGGVSSSTTRVLDLHIQRPEYVIMIGETFMHLRVKGIVHATIKTVIIYHPSIHRLDLLDETISYFCVQQRKEG